MKRIWNAIGKTAKDANYQLKAVKQMESIEQGRVKVAAPKVPTEERRFEEAQKDNKAKEDLEMKHVPLVKNMGQIHVKSIDPPEIKSSSKKDLPTRESEWRHRNDPMWEFGFYEPDVEKIPKNKLMFREALEILRSRQELLDEESSSTALKRREIASKALADHPGVERVQSELIDDMFEYFRPFERKDWQKVVNKHDLSQLQDHMQGRSDDALLVDGARDHVREMLKDKRAREHYDRLEEEERRQFQEAVKKLRAADHDRLEKRLKEINEIEVGIKEAVEDQKKKNEEKKEG